MSKTVIVTGSGQGIGRGIALAFAKEGYKVVVSDLNEENAKLVAKEITELGKEAIAIKCDVSKKTEVDNLVSKTIEKFSTVDVLVNNAGIFPFTPFLDMTEENWDKVINVNTKSIFLTTQAVAKVMPEGGRIIDISSIASVVGFEGLAHYCASKGAINSTIRAMALELAHKKITVNAIAPGAVETPGASTTAMDENAKKQMLAMIPMGRSGQPDDIAGPTLFLASDKANYITGQTIVVDGGWTLR